MKAFQDFEPFAGTTVEDVAIQTLTIRGNERDITGMSRQTTRMKTRTTLKMKVTKNAISRLFQMSL